MDENRRMAITRREFATRAALAGAAATLGASPPLAQAGTPVTLPPVEQTPGAATGATAAQNEAELRVQTIVALYPGRFSESQKKDLLKMSSSTQKSLDHLRAFKIENSDEPALHLKPLMEREKKPATAPGGATADQPARKS